ncbi:MAG: hypothetical protein AAF529_18625 [Pseudomonadota bacterium]
MRRCTQLFARVHIVMLAAGVPVQVLAHHGEASAHLSWEALAVGGMLMALVAGGYRIYRNRPARACTY